jgi:hypothetical protein
MKTILLLNESTEPPDVAIPILPEIRKDPDEPYADCTCDRWGHPCARCNENESQQVRSAPRHAFNRETR